MLFAHPDPSFQSIQNNNWGSKPADERQIENLVNKYEKSVGRISYGSSS